LRPLERPGESTDERVLSHDRSDSQIRSATRRSWDPTNSGSRSLGACESVRIPQDYLRAFPIAGTARNIVTFGTSWNCVLAEEVGVRTLWLDEELNADAAGVPETTRRGSFVAQVRSLLLAKDDDEDFVDEDVEEEDDDEDDDWDDEEDEDDELEDEEDELDDEEDDELEEEEDDVEDDEEEWDEEEDDEDEDWDDEDDEDDDEDDDLDEEEELEEEEEEEWG
jgi:hypothetical protein